MNELLYRLITVHQCIGCGKILPYKDIQRIFCVDCREIYLTSQMEICPKCAQPVKECFCMPDILKKVGILKFRKLFFYDKNKRSMPQNKLIYFLKRKNVKRIARELTNELAPIIKKELDDIGEYDNAVLVSVPRSKHTRNVYGFDQAAFLCRFLSEGCGIEFLDVIRRKRGSSQKSLTVGERRKNMVRLLYADKKNIDKVHGKTVVLVDDVVTTGASMAACIDIILKSGAKNVICIALSSDINR